MKQCTKCHKLKDINEYSKDKSRKSGLKVYCKACCRIIWNKKKEYYSAIQKEWYIRNKEIYNADRRSPEGREKHRLQQKEWLKKMPELTREKVKRYQAAFMKKWQQSNRDKVRMSCAKWSKNNRGIANSISARRRAAKLQRTPKWLTKAQILEIRQFYIIAKELQWLSDPTDRLEVDHIIPLQGETVSGLHVPWNLQILPKSQNSAKSNRF